MARYTGPRARLSRREGQNLYLKGTRNFSEKDDYSKRPYPPGEHGQAGARRRNSEYGLQLREKQKTKRFYGLLEAQFRNLYEKADQLDGNTADNFLTLLEMRLDNVVYRLGFADSRSQARQLVNHSHFNVNGKKVNIPSTVLEAGDVIEVRDSSKKSAIFQDLEVTHMIPEWLEFDEENLKGKIIRLPEREEVDLDVDARLIVELYSR